MEEKEKLKNEQDLFMMGDIHGSFEEMTWTLTQRHKIRDANIILLGDFGVGFNKPAYYDNLFNKVICPKLEENNLSLFVIRGNHDDPEYFNGEHDYPRIKFLKDHELITLSEKIIYPIGGAISHDKAWRIEYNKKMESYGSSKRVWWPNEGVIKEYKNLPGKVDIIVSHTSPLSFPPVIVRGSSETDEDYLGMLEERKYLDYVFRNVRCKYWIGAHWHTSLTFSLEDVLYKCLDINELYKFN